jgi:sulfur relay protein TusB/DsrH
MSVLHLIQQPTNHAEFDAQLELYFSDNDSVLFLNDAAFSLPSVCKSQELGKVGPFQGEIFALKEQVVARGLMSLLDLEKVKLIDYHQFIALNLQAQKSITW